MSMKKKRATTIATATIFGKRIVGRMIIKKMVPSRIITENKGAEESTVMETDGKMQETEQNYC
jgi:hypothetical protein